MTVGEQYRRPAVLLATSIILLNLLLCSVSASQHHHHKHQQVPAKMSPQLLGRVYAVLAGELAKNPARAAEQLRAEAAAFRASNAGTFSELSPECGIVFSSLLSTVLGLVGGVDIPEFMEFLKWLDAIGKPEAGILLGNLKWIGSREECEGLRLPIYQDPNNSSSLMFKTSGRYCTFKVNNTQTKNSSFSGGDMGTQLRTNLELAMCLPNPCKGRDAEIAVNFVINFIFGFLGPILQGIPGLGGIVDSLKSFSLVVSGCSVTSQETGSSLHAIAVVVIALTVVIVAVILTATVVTAYVARKKAEDNSVYQNICRAFCLRTNLTKIFAPPAADSLACLNGIRVLSIFWVILGHSLYLAATLLDNPLQLLNDFRKRWQSVLIINATTSVDSFFLLSGTLVAFVFFRRVGTKKHDEGRDLVKSAKFWLFFYLHRYWRLTPPLMFFLIWYLSLLRYFGNGTFLPKDRVMLDTTQCEKNWWTLPLYVQNFFGVSESCMGHTWYLANDMQMYFVSPLMLLPFYFGGIKFGAVVSIGVVAGSMISTGVINSHFGFKRGHLNFVPGNQDGYDPNASYYEEIYVKPYCRMGAYAIGIFLGYILAARKTVKLPWLAVLLGWLLATAVSLTLLYLVQPQIAGTSGDLTVPQVTAYWSFLRPGFALCVAWVIFACVYGYGGPINSLLSWSWFAPLARLTYCAYIVHVCVIYMFEVTYDYKFHLSDSFMIMIYLFNLVASFLAALLLSTVIEAPLIGLERALLSLDERRAQVQVDPMRSGGYGMTSDSNKAAPPAYGRLYAV